MYMTSMCFLQSKMHIMSMCIFRLVEVVRLELATPCL